MKLTISIQETTVTPAKDGLIVQLYLSNKPRDSAGAAMRIALHATIPRMRRSSLAKMQHETLALRAMPCRVDGKVDEDERERPAMLDCLHGCR